MALEQSSMVVIEPQCTKKYLLQAGHMQKIIVEVFKKNSSDNQATAK
jgi:hypothetical protein